MDKSSLIPPHVQNACASRLKISASSSSAQMASSASLPPSLAKATLRMRTLLEKLEHVSRAVFGAVPAIVKPELLPQVPSEGGRSAGTPTDLLVRASVGGGSRQQAHMGHAWTRDACTCSQTQRRVQVVLHFDLLRQTSTSFDRLKGAATQKRARIVLVTSLHENRKARMIKGVVFGDARKPTARAADTPRS
ncbi:hypothetical protein EVG20_g6096 [Dentipellis fragilis]|uniref:Uncharacterized protein n=1 Tax=Dentipellis fragilis TaxID=205917 RepID=A0A4Y9YQN9_9AGAM|nr:hypothetical protein EVG20_g6096 [Dentipellis fragilis]